MPPDRPKVNLVSVTNLDVATPTKEPKAPTKKKKEIFVTTYDLQDDF